LFRDDYSEYMEENFGKYILENKDASPVDKVKTFIVVALGFPLIVGVELTKLTFVVNLSLKSSETSFFSDCIEQDLFFEAIQEGIDKSLFRNDLSVEEIVNYFYSFLTGAFMTWCLSDLSYDMLRAREKYVDALIKGLQQ
jgi:TetR/AcrR family fatty acid metabolism transcriptional regulator